MTGKLFNSFLQACLVKGYGWTAKLVDLEGGFWGEIYQRLYFNYKRWTERDTLQFIKKITQPDSLVIDIGANIGFFTLETCKLPGRRIIAFEPEPKNYRNLLKNISKRGFEKIVSSHRIALSNTSGCGSLYLSTLAPTDHKITGDSRSNSIDVEFMRLDDFYNRNQFLFDRPISLIKIDVQGAELMVSEGMLTFLNAVNWPVLLVEYTPFYLGQAGVKCHEFLEFFLKLGYLFYNLDMQKSLTIDTLLQFEQAYRDIVMIHQSSEIIKRKLDNNTVSVGTNG